MIEILNARTNKPLPEDAIYVGLGSPPGNPFRMSTRLSREDNVARYRVRLLELSSQPGRVRDELLYRSDLYRQFGFLQSVCWRVPEPCHGDLIAGFIKQQMSEAL